MPTDTERREAARSRVAEARRALDRAMWALSVPEPDWLEVAAEADKVNDLMCRLWAECISESWRVAAGYAATADCKRGETS